MRTNFRKVLALIVSVLMLCTIIPMGALSVSAAETVVYSADFESGYGNWKASAGTIETATPPVANPNGGGLALKHDTGSDYPYLCDNTAFTVTANTDYILTFDALLGNNNGFPVNGIIGGNYWLGEVIAETGTQTAKTAEWTTYTLEFNSGTKTKLYMGLKSVYTTTTVYFDNVKIIEKPTEPEPEVPAGGPNLVTNGNFEDGNSGWRFSSAASVVSGGYTGNAIQLNNPAAWSEAGYQEVTVEDHESYTLTWRSKRVSGSGVFNMEIAKAPYDGMKPQVTGQTWMNDTSGNWVEHKIKIVMTDKDGTGTGISKIMIKLTTEATNPGVILIDDIVLTKDLVASFDGYIHNGDFEIGNIDHWTGHNGTTASTAAAHSGYYGAYLKSNGSWGGVMSQGTVNVVAGKTYIVSYWIKVIKNSMGIQIKDGTTASGTTLSSKTHNTGDWTQVTFEVKPTQNGLFINFHGSGGENANPDLAAEAYVDDIKVELKGGKPEEKVIYGGSSVRDEAVGEGDQTGKGLAFQFKVSVEDGVKNYNNTFGGGNIVLGDERYTLVRMGAVMTNNATVGQNVNNFNLSAVNGGKVINIPATYLNGADAESLSFAVRILDIPDRHIGTSIYARPYYVYKDGEEEVTVYGATRSNNYAKAANISTADKTKPIKILSIGHSFSKDVMTTNLYNMFIEGGYTDVTIGYLYMAGCSMPKHLYNIQNNKAQYEYAKNNNGTWVTKNATPALAALKEEDWDFVTVQSSPDYIGGQTISSFNEGINNNGAQVTLSNPQTEYEAMDQITDWIKANATNANVKIDYHMIWSFSQGCDLWSGMYHKDPNTNKYSQMVMFQNIVNITQDKVQNHEDINRIIPSATAIQNARSSFMGDTFNMPDATQGGSDGYHLNDYGDYVAALTWYCHYSGDNAQIMAGYLGDGTVLNLTNEEFLAIAEAVNNAIDIPFAVTESTHK